MAQAGATRSADARRAEVLTALRDDYEFYAAQAVKIRTKQGEVIPFAYKRPQRRLARALMGQRAEGEPQRAVILKSRQVGFSTQAQALMVQRATQRPFHFAMVVAQDRQTASELFGIGRFAWSMLPVQIRPEIAFERNSLDQKLMHFGQASQNLRRQGLIGLESQIQIATAKVAAGGRGMTIHSLHLSEVAFWDQTGKLLGLYNAVPDDPESLILVESTPNGHNHFHDLWELAVSGASGYYPMYSPWFEEEAYRRRFATDRDMADFERTVGAGTREHPEYGEDEVGLLELIPEQIARWHEEDCGFAVEEGTPPPIALTGDELRVRILEHLNWRRWAIGQKCEGSVEKFHQEYSSTPGEAFLSTGRKVFAPRLAQKVLDSTEKSDLLAVPGLFRGADVHAVRARAHATVEVPRSAEWVPRARARPEEASNWRIWTPPARRHLDPSSGLWVPDGQYIVACDPASGEEDRKGVEHADHAVQIIDHRTLKQVAEYRSRCDPDLLAHELLLAALRYNRAWIVVESTGGYGLSILRILSRDFKYPRVFEDESRDKRLEDRSERLGFHTDAVSKPLIEARALELVREGTHGIRSRALALQMLSFVRNNRGRTGPESGKLADLLMAWMIGQYVATLRPVRPDRKPGPTSTATRTVRSAKTGW